MLVGIDGVVDFFEFFEGIGRGHVTVIVVPQVTTTIDVVPGIETIDGRVEFTLVELAVVQQLVVWVIVREISLDLFERLLQHRQPVGYGV
ncbi:hypothetical protein E0T84_00935 [Mycobacterium sp. DBP42]|nr:hypothetical protein E0T84_00935 [Mycobacterium sp. DBP42]